MTSLSMTFCTGKDQMKPRHLQKHQIQMVAESQVYDEATTMMNMATDTATTLGSFNTNAANQQLSLKAFTAKTKCTHSNTDNKYTRRLEDLQLNSSIHNDTLSTQHTHLHIATQPHTHWAHLTLSSLTRSCVVVK